MRIQRSNVGFRLAAAAVLLNCSLLPAQNGPSASAITEPNDKYAWLEDATGPRSMDWVKAEDARTDAVLKADPRYQTNYDIAYKVASDPHRLPLPQLRGDEIYNLWRDTRNPRGLLRKTTLAD